MSAIAALTIFVVAFVFIATEKVDKVKVVLIAAGAMVVLGLAPGAEVFFSEHEGIDWKVIFLLLGMMIIVGIIKQTGVFDYLAIWAAKRSGGRPYRLMVMLMAITAVASPFLDNVTTIMLVAPVTVVVCNRLAHLRPAVPDRRGARQQHRWGGDVDRRPAKHHHRQPGRAELRRLPGPHGADRRGDLRGVRALTRVLFARSFRVQPGARRGGHGAPGAPGHHRRLLVRCLVVLGLVIVGFGLHSVLHIDPSIVAMVGAGRDAPGVQAGRRRGPERGRVADAGVLHGPVRDGRRRWCTPA